MKNDKQQERMFELLYWFEQLCRFFAVFGRCLCENHKSCARALRAWCGRYVAPLAAKAAGGFGRIGGFFGRRFAGVQGACAAIFHSFGILAEDIRMLWEIGADCSVKTRIRKTLRYLAGPAKQRKRLLITTLNYAMPALALVIAINMISGLVHTNYAFAVTYNGVELGYIQDEAVYSDAAKDLQSRIIIPDDGEGVSVNAELTLRAIGSEDEVVSSAELTNRMMRNANQDIVEADGVYVDGVFIGAVENIGAAEDYLNDKLNEYLLTTGYETATFTREITTEKGFYVADNIISYDELIALFESEVTSDQYYTVQAGDTPIGIAAEQDVDYHDLIQWNPGIDKMLIAGDEILIGVSEPYLSILATTTDVYTSKVAYDTVKEKTDKLYIGETEVKQEGVDGKQKITAEVTLLNGVETERTIVSKKVTKEPVDEILLVGTKEPDPVTVPAGVTTYSGNNNTGIWLSWPTDGGYISSAYGARWGSFHRAIDIAKRGGCYGDKIYAAADGTVTFVGYSGTYGKLIKISHGNGLETWYAHCSGYNVSRGDKVSRGETIGYIGNTGRSTGPHLHFQVMLNGSYVNPVYYLK